MKIKSLKLCAGLLLALFSASVAWGFDLYDPPVNWPAGSVPMQIRLGASPGLSDGSNYTTSVQAAMQTWNAVLGSVQFAPQVVAPGAASNSNNDVNEIVFSDTIEGSAFGDGVLAVTLTSTFTSINRIAESDVLFNTAYAWDSFRGGQLAGKQDIRRVAIHELGHVLGLGHPDEAGQSVTAIMNSHVSYSPAIDTLQADDIAGAQALYTASANNSFASATELILGNNAAFSSGTNFAATKEAGEPNHAGDTGGASLWWKWTAPSNGTATFTTLDSTFDTLLAAYTGTSVSALSAVASNDDVQSGVIRTSAITFTATAGTTYFIAVDGWDGAVGSVALHLNFAPALTTTPPVITGQPANQSANAGQTVQFTVSATGAPAPSYQWQRQPAGVVGFTDLSNGDSYAGVNTATISVSNASGAMNGDQFRCVVSNIAGSGTSTPALLTVAPPPTPPVILTEPAPQTVAAGANAQFAVVASGTATLNYRWQESSAGNANWSDLINNGSYYGVSTSTLTVSASIAVNGHSFRCVVSNPFGNATSRAAVLNVTGLSVPTITTQSTAQVASIGGGASYSVAAVGAQAFQWQILVLEGTDWSNLPETSGYIGTNTATLAIRGVAPGASGAQFRCIVSNSVGSATSQAALLTVNLNNIISISAGYNHSLFVKSDGTLWAMGANIYGELGDGTHELRSTPVLIATGVAQGSATLHGSLFVKSDGTLWGMGINSYGQLGDGTTTERASPVLITTGVAKAYASGAHSLFIKTDGSLWGMGVVHWSVGGGQALTPVQIASDVVTAAAGLGCTLFVKTDGSLWTVGQNDFGKLGDGTVLSFQTPKQIAFGVKEVSAFEYHSLFVKDDGTLWAMGMNTFGELGDGTTIDRQNPVQVASGVSKAFAGGQHTLFIKNDGTLWATGGNIYGQLGTGTGVNTSSPVLISTGVLDASAVYQFSLFLKTDSTLWAMGSNYYGQFGDGTTQVNRLEPKVVVSNAAPVIWTQPVAQTVPVGAAVNFSVFATSPLPMSYQWRKNGVDVLGATSAELAIANAQTSDAGNYSVVVTNSTGSATSSPALLTVALPPIITVQPASRTVNVGSMLSLSVAVASGATITYQWQMFNGIWNNLAETFPFSGTTSTTLAIASTSYISNNVQFRCVATNAGGSVVSNAAAVTLTFNPVISSPVSQTLVTGSALNLSVSVGYYSGVGLTFQWFKNGAAIPGANTNTFFVSSVGLSDAGDYRVVVTDSRGTATSDIATIAVLPSTGVVAASAALNHTTFTRVDGSLWIFGYPNLFTIGRPGDSPLFAADHVVKSALNSGHTYFLKDDGSVWSLGATAGANGVPLGFDYPPVQIDSGAVDVATGIGAVYVLKSDGTLWSKGNNDFGQLGDGTTGYRAEFVQVATDVVQVSAAFGFMAFVKSDGTLWATGANSQGELGDGTMQTTRLLPVQVASGARSVSCNGAITLFTKTDGTLWGMGELGSIGLTGPSNSSQAVPLLLAADVISFSSGQGYLHYVTSDGILWARGLNFFGQLGDGTNTDRRSGSVQIASGVATVASGLEHTIFVKKDGSVWTMGHDDVGQLGNGPTLTADQSTPNQIASGPLSAPAAPTVLTASANPLTASVRINWMPMVGATGYEVWRSTTNNSATAVRIASDVANALYVDRDAVPGTTYFYFVRAVNPVGTGPFGNSVTILTPTPPVPVIATQPQNQTIAIGEPSVSFSVVTTSPTAQSYLWQRQIANSSTWLNVVDSAGFTGSTTPGLTINSPILDNSGDQYRCVISNAVGSVTSHVVTLTVITPGFAKFSAGRYHSLRLDNHARLFATGANVFGQLGNGNTTTVSTPQRITVPGQTIVDIAAGAQHSLILTSAKELWATGINANGQLGDGTLVAKSTPIRIATNVVGIAAGVFHSVFLKADGTLWAVGGNDSGQLGNGKTADSANPVQVATGVIDVTAGIRQTLFVKADHTLWGAGDMNGSGVAISTPVQIATNVAKIAAGGYHSLFVKADGTLWSMGYNVFGQLGIGSTVTATSPVQIATGVKTVAAGYFHSLFTTAEDPRFDTLMATGYNSGGQLGDGSTTSRSTPALMQLGVVAASAGESYTLFTSSDGRLWASGYNANGQFGNGSTTSTNAAVLVAEGALTVPEAPTGLSASPAASLDRVHLTWQPAADASNYEVWRNTTNNSAGATRIAQNVRWAIYDDLSVANGQAFCYWIKAVNPAGASAFGQSAFVSLGNTTAPSITTQPGSQTVTVGSSVTFSVVAGGTAPFTYQWRKDDAPVAAATAASFTINSAAVVDAGSYSVVVTNSAGSTPSNIATLTVDRLGQTITFGAPADQLFSVAPISLTATASSSLPVSFTVVSGPANVSGSTLTLTGVGVVTVRASQAGDATYTAATNVDRAFTAAPSFASWQVDKFTTAELADANLSGPNAVFGADGIPNLVKYALGLEPKQNATTGLPEMSMTATDWVYTYTRPASITDITYAVEVSTTLTAWDTAGVVHERIATANGIETWQARVPLGTAAKVFFRLQVTRP